MNNKDPRIKSPSAQNRTPVNGRPANYPTNRQLSQTINRPVNRQPDRPVNPNGVRRRRRKPKVTVGKIILRILACILALVLMLVATLYFALGMMCSGKIGENGEISEILYITVPTFLETGAFKFIPSLYLSSNEIQTIVDSNKMADMDADVDEGLINIGSTGKKGTLDINVSADAEAGEGGIVDSGEPIEVHEISGATYFGTMIVVKDPSRVSLATIYPWRDEGVTLDELVNSNGAIAGINGGLYNSNGNTGGRPYGVIVSNGEVQLNDPTSFAGLVLVGFTESNILQIIDLAGMSASDVEALIKEKKIRDAVTFQDEASDANNHFVQLIINDVDREMNGMGSGLNPRTAIGQRADGAVLMFVTDGRGKSGHLGASASDLIEVMRKFGAVNAANLDGGSSSCMYYDGEYLMTSVTFYYSNSSWKLPAGFVVK